MKTIQKPEPRHQTLFIAGYLCRDNPFSYLFSSFNFYLYPAISNKMRKTLNFIISRISFRIIAMAGVAFMLYSAPVFAQGVGKKGKAKKPAMHSTLPEAEVTPTVKASLLKVAPLRVNVSVLNPTSKVVNVSIRNYSGNSVFQESFRGNEYYRTFNFSQIKSGNYSFCISGRKYFERQPFKVTLTRHRTMVPGDLIYQNASTIVAAIYEVEPLKVRLHLGNNGRKNTEYLIRSKEKGIIHQGYTKDEKLLKTFDMNYLPPGTYTVEVKTRGEKISRAFDIRSSEERSFVWLDKRGKPLVPAATDYPSVLILR
jgi:hypothetical protein